MASTVKVQLQSLNRDLTFAAKSASGHWTMIDTGEKGGGNQAAPTPLELLLEALGGCTGMDTLSILKKKRTPFRHLEIFIEGEKREEHPGPLPRSHCALSCIRTAATRRFGTFSAPRR
ncbi:MAG: OsmC family protein [Candidatus Marinimicrobia bacterium]|nr:OsmC family protein [Candidatus Neomarinimicrobiota bacterium]